MENVVLKCSLDKVDPCLERETLMIPDPAGGAQLLTGCLAELRRGQPLLPLMICDRGLLKKAASGVLAIFPCSRTTRTLRA